MNKHQEYMAQWKAYFIGKYGAKPYCEVCGKELKWVSDKASEVVHWDHRHGLGGIEGSPSAFSKSRPANEGNILFFEDQDFGMLCRKCNAFLPTDPLERIKKIDALKRYQKKTVSKW